METIDLVEEEEKIAENQITFDLNNIPSLAEEEEDEKSLLPDVALKIEDYEWAKNDVLFVILKAVSASSAVNFGTPICGRPMLDWVVMAAGGCETKIIDECEDVFKALKNIKTNKPYIYVLYSDTPLIQKTIVFKILNIFVRRRQNVMKLARGFIFKTEYLQNADNFILGSSENLGASAFRQVLNGESLVLAERALQTRIINFHAKNGVIFSDPKTVTIDADVEIDEGTIIKRNNVLKGSTIIGKNCLLQEDNIIVRSVVGENCSLLGCKLLDSNISSGRELLLQSFANQKY